MARLVRPTQAAALLALFATGCMHVTHPAEVKPGLAVDLTAGAGVAIERTHISDEPVSYELYDIYNLQLGFRYGWRFSEEVALQIALGQDPGAVSGGLLLAVRAFGEDA